MIPLLRLGIALASCAALGACGLVGTSSAPTTATVVVTVPAPAATAAAPSGTRPAAATTTAVVGNLGFRQASVLPANAAVEEAVGAFARATRPVVAVSNEVGQGLVPAEAGSRRFRDEMGVLNMRLAEVVDEVWFCTAGIPARLK